MSIIIPGVELPPIDEYLHLRIDGNGYVSAQISAVECVCFLADTDRKAIELPPHGRLIDADKLERMFADIDNAPYSGFDGEDPFYSAGDAVQIIRLAPTILQADPEGGADNGQKS